MASRAPVGAGEPARGGPPGPGDGAARHVRRPGEEAQIDYGQLGMWLDPATGRRRTVWAFVMVLSLLAAHVRAPDADHGPGRVDRRACGGVRVLRRRPGPAGPGQPEDRGRPARPLRPEDQPVVCGAGRALRHPGRPGPRRASRRTRRRSSGRCPMCGTRSGGAGSSPRSPQMQAAALAWCAGRRRAAGVPAAGRGGPGRGVRRGRGAQRCGRCRRRRSCWRPGRRAQVGPDIHAKVGGTLYSLPWRLLGRPRRRPLDTDHGAVLPPRTADQDPSAQGPRQADRPAATTRRRRSPSTCAPRPGAAAAPPRSARPASR